MACALAGPYFYLPKMQSHLEARLWNDVFVEAQAELGVPRGSIRVRLKPWASPCIQRAESWSTPCALLLSHITDGIQGASCDGSVCRLGQEASLVKPGLSTSHAALLRFVKML